MVDESKLAKTGLREQVSERVLTAVFEKRMASGEHLVVQRLSEMFGVSPTPVREALVELAGLGIVDMSPNRGATVRPFGLTQMREMAQVRRVLEVEAARGAAQYADKSVLVELKKELDELDTLVPGEARDLRARAADTLLHGWIADHCNNERLAAEIRRYLSLFGVLRNVSHLRDSWNDYRHSDDVPEHIEIVRALIAGDAERAAKVVDKHVRSVEKTLREVLFTPSSTAGADI